MGIPANTCFGQIFHSVEIIEYFCLDTDPFYIMTTFLKVLPQFVVTITKPEIIVTFW